MKRGTVVGREKIAGRKGSIEREDMDAGSNQEQEAGVSGPYSIQRDSTHIVPPASLRIHDGLFSVSSSTGVDRE